MGVLRVACIVVMFLVGDREYGVDTETVEVDMCETQDKGLVIEKYEFVLCDVTGQGEREAELVVIVVEGIMDDIEGISETARERGGRTTGRL